MFNFIKKFKKRCDDFAEEEVKRINKENDEIFEEIFLEEEHIIDTVIKHLQLGNPKLINVINQAVNKKEE